MSYVGLDVERLRAFAQHLRGTAASAGSVHRDVAEVLEEAQAALHGRPATLSFTLQQIQSRRDAFHLPTPLVTTLPTAAASIDRRCDHLAACEVLLADGRPVHLPFVFADETPPDPAKVQAALDALSALPDLDTGVNGNRDDLRRVAALLEGLTQAELDLVLDGADEDDLRWFGDAVTTTSDAWWTPFDHNGLPVGERVGVAGTLLSRASPSHVRLLGRVMPWMTPGFDTTDVFLDGVNPQTGLPAADIRYGRPAGDLFVDGVSVQDVSQGRLGDCWFVASIAATAQVDPEFLARNLRENANGTVSVRLWDRDGTERWVTVTRDLPVDSSGSPLGAAGPGELWPAYYEKAFALLYEGDRGGAPDGKQGDPRYDRAEQGTYGALEWDWTKQAPPYVTGHPSRELDRDADDVREAFAGGSPVIVASASDLADVPQHLQSGYAERHVFYVREITDDHVVLANPWGPSSPTLRLTPEEFEEHFDSFQALDLEEAP